MRIVRVVLALAAAAAAGCTGPVQATAQQTAIRLAVGSPLLRDAYRKLLPHYSFEIVATGGSVTQLEAVQNGSADVGNAMADVAYLASRGQLGALQAFDKLRGIAVMQPTAVHVLVPAASKLKTIGALRGARVALGAPGSETVLASKLLLEAFGVSVESVHGEFVPFPDLGDRLKPGDLDAAFISSRYPSDNVTKAIRRGARLLDVDGPAVERLRREYPFMRKALIPEGAYEGYARAVHTIAIDNLLLCRVDLDEHLVYELTKALLDVLPYGASGIAPFPQFDLRRAPATPLPLHIGAARYYRERELFQ
jgi:uncharacterized protein